MAPLRSLAAFILLLPVRVLASPLGNADEIQVGGAGGTNLVTAVINIVRTVLSYMSLAAVIVIIIAGIWMIVGLGEESSKERAKKIVLYAIIGLLLILLARGIVIFVIRL